MSATDFKPNEMQSNIINWFVNGFGHGSIEAVAGAGKTSTLIKLFDCVPVGKTLAYGVYNRKNADEAKEKVGFRPGIFINTAHGFGNAAWKKAYPSSVLDANLKWARIADHLDLYIDQPEGDKSPRKYKHEPLANTIKALIGFAKDAVFGLLVDPKEVENWMAIVDHHNLEQNFSVNDQLPVDVGAQLLTACCQAYKGLQYSNQIAPEVIDFSDMIFMPLISEIRMWKYDFVFIDEAQDTNPARRELFKRMLKPNGRLIAVGDRYQAIYGFTGADANSLDKIQQEMNAISLPLTVSFRCPKAVVRVAKRYVSHIESHEDALEGSTRLIKDHDLLTTETLDATDAIVCRNTAPLVSLAYTLLKKGIACHIEGKDIGEGLIKMINMWSSVKTIGTFEKRLNDYVERQAAKCMASGQEAKAMVLYDKKDTLAALMDGMSLDAPLTDLKNKIANLFSNADDSKKQTLTLLTIHKSKGLEYDRVYWYGANAFQPSPFARQEWQMDQEINLCYVAATRAKKELVEVIVPKESRRRGEY